MFVRLADLRLLIEQRLIEVDLNQALAGVIPARPKPGVDVRPDEKERGKSARYFAGKKFIESTRLFNNLATKVYLVPTPAGDETFDVGLSSGHRGGVMQGTEAKELLDSLHDVDSTFLMSEIQAGACVIVVTSSSPGNFDNLPSAWMVIHALFEVESAFTGNRTFWAGLCDDLGRACDEEDYHKVLTMKSARDNNVASFTDAAAEIITQSLLDRRGFRFNPTGNEETDARFDAIKVKLERFKPQFEAMIAGKLLIVTV